eukprot:scaffold786_cov37-Cyclotella_meneghiniana.AAC.6
MAKMTTKAKRWSPDYRTKLWITRLRCLRITGLKMMTTSCRTTRPEGGKRTMMSKTYQGKQLVVIT